MASTELESMKKIEEFLLRLDDTARQRVMRYLVDRFGSDADDKGKS